LCIVLDVASAYEYGPLRRVVHSDQQLEESALAAARLAAQADMAAGREGEGEVLDDVHLGARVPERHALQLYLWPFGTTVWHGPSRARGLFAPVATSTGTGTGKDLNKPRGNTTAVAAISVSSSASGNTGVCAAAARLRWMQKVITVDKRRHGLNGWRIDTDATATHTLFMHAVRGNTIRINAIRGNIIYE
jgi:hypothetical protein